MDSQETANSMAQSAPGHEENMVKPNVLSPPQGFQARPQGPPPSPRNSINNGPIGAPRPGQPLRRLDSRSSLGPSPASGQFIQHRPYGPPRPPGSSFPPRSLQPGQLPPQNPLHPSNQRFVYSPGIRGPPPQGAGGQRPPFAGNQQVYQVQQQQQQQQQQQRGSNDPRFQRPDIAPENGPRRPSQESVFPRQLLRNDSSLSLQRQHLSSNEEIKQPTRPRIVIEKMADINETNVDKPESYLQRKKSDVHENGENDDDDDVVMDNEKSLRHNQDGVPEGLVNGSKSPLIPTKPMIRPGTATIEKPSKYHDKISKEFAEDTASIISQSRPSSAVNDDKEERKDEKLFSRPPSSKEIDIVENLTEDFTRDEVNVLLVDDLMNNKTSRPPSGMLPSELIEEIEEIQKPSSPYNDNAFGNIEQSLKTPPKSSDNSRSITPSYLDTPQNAEQAISRTPSRTSDMSRSSTPAHLDAPENAEQNKTPDKSRSSTPAGLESHGNAEQESKTLIKTPDKSRANTPAESQLLGNAEHESKTPIKTPDKSRANTPAESQLVGNAEQESKTPIKTPDKSRANTPAESQLVGNAEQESKTPIKTPDKSRANTPAESQLVGNAEQESKTPIKTPDKSRANTPAESQLLGNAEQESKTPIKTPDKSRANTPAESQLLGNAEQESKAPIKTPDKSRANTPAELQLLGNAEQELKTPIKTPDKSRANTPAESQLLGNAEQESKTPIKAPDKSRANTPAGSEPPGNAEQESKTPDKYSRASTPAAQLAPSPNAEKEPHLTPTKVSDKSRSSTPAGIESSDGETSIENPQHDKSGKDTLQVRESSRPASSTLRSPNSAIGKDGKSSPKSPRSPTIPEGQGKLSMAGSVISPRSPEGVKGFDNGEQRSLSSGGSPRLSKSPKSPAKQTEAEKKKKTSFVETTVKKSVEIADTEPILTATSPSKSTAPTTKTPRPQTPAKPDDEKKSPKKKAIQNGSESQANAASTANGVAESPTKRSKESDKRSTAGSPTKSPSKSVKSLPRTPDTPSSTAQEKKKVPMNKVQVGAAPSPNLKTVRSKIGSLDNASYKPGGGKVKIENRKLDFSKAQPKIAAKNDKYMPSGGDKKISQVKLQWNAKPKVGSLENATYKPGGGDKKIETVKLDFKDKAKPKVGSKENAKHIPGGGAVKSATPPKTPQETKNDIPTQKIDIKAESKIGSMDNVKHKPGGGEKKIFNDRDYLRQTSSNVESLNGSGSQPETPVNDRHFPNDSKMGDNEILQPQPPPSTPTKARGVTSPSSIVTPRAVRSGLAKSPESTTPRRQLVQETEGLTLANGRASKTPSPDATNDRNTPKGRSPTAPRPPSSLRVKSANDKSSPNTPRKTSPGTPGKTSPGTSSKTSPGTPSKTSPGTPSKTSPGTPSKTSSGTPRKSPSPRELRLPKLASSPIPQEASPAAPETHSKITLPKLIEPSSKAARMAY